MTAFDYGRTVQTANRLIARFGAEGAIRRTGDPTGPDYDPTPGEVVNHACQLVVTDYEAREIDGTRIKASDKKVYVAKSGLAIEPTTADELVDGAGSVYAIVTVKPLQPGPTVVLWEVQCRR